MTQNKRSDTVVKFAHRYGAYIVGALAPLACLTLAVALPLRSDSLVSAAAAYGLLVVWSTRENAPYLKRFLGLVSAAILLAFALLLPAQANQLFETAGILAGLAIWLW